MFSKVGQRRKIIICIALILCLVIDIPSGNLASAAAAGTQEKVPTIDSAKMYIAEGSTKKLEVDNLDQDAVISYRSTDSSIASVNENGVVTAVSNGQTKVTVQVQQADKEYNLTVTINVIRSTDTQVILEQTDVTLGLGETWKSGILLVPTGSSELVTYSSDDSTIAQVDNMGSITAAAIGTTEVKASLLNGNCIVYHVTVINAPESITFPFEEKTIKTGNRYKLEPVINTAFTNCKLNYESSNESVATVDENGEVEAVSPGTAKIRVTTYNGKSASVTIRVADEIGSFNIPYISGKSITLARDQSRSLYYTVKPSNLSDYVKRHLVWSSDNKNIAVVNKNGKVTAKKTGKTRITLSTSDGSAEKVTITVYVKSRKNGTSFSQDNLSIVSTSKSKYTYQAMAADLKALEKRYGDCVKVSVLANSYDKRNIYQIILGNPNAKKKVMVQASVHGREYMASLLVMKQIEFYCRNYYSGTYHGKYFSELFNDVAFYIVPMANPDGVTISQYGASAIRDKALREKVISICKKYGRGRNSYYTRWKYNARGVNINLNFDAYWKISRGLTKEYGYKGRKANSELETKALVKLYDEIKPSATLSYHATGSIIYWDFGQKGFLQKKSYQLAKIIESQTSYSFVRGFNKYYSAGFSDWVSIKKKTCAITIEIGKNACPLSIKEFPSIWSKNRLIYTAYAEFLIP